MAAGDRIFYADNATIIAGTLQKPICKLTQTVAQSLTHNADTVLTFSTGSELYDTHNFHSETVNNSRITPTVAGYYRCTGLVFVDVISSISNIGAVIRLNGTVQTPRARIQPLATTFNKSVQVTTILQANGSSDYFELAGYQFDTGSVARNTAIGGTFASCLEVEFLRSL